MKVKDYVLKRGKRSVDAAGKILDRKKKLVETSRRSELVRRSDFLGEDASSPTNMELLPSFEKKRIKRKHALLSVDERAKDKGGYSAIKNILTLVIIVGVTLNVYSGKYQPLNFSRILVGFCWCLLPATALGAPLVAMNHIQADLLKSNAELGYVYWSSKLTKDGLWGLKRGIGAVSSGPAWAMAKLVMFLPIIIISLFQYIIPLVIGIALGIFTAVFTLGAAVFFWVPVVPEIAESAVLTLDDITETIGVGVDKLGGSVIKKVFRTLNVYLPIRRFIRFYIVGYMIYDWLFPLIMKIYMSFAIIIIIHFALNLSMKPIFKGVAKLNNPYVKMSLYAIVLSLYYLAQFYFSIKFLIDGKDPVWIIRSFFEDISPSENLDIFKNIDEIFGDSNSSNFLRTVYVIIALIATWLVAEVSKRLRVL